jgi:ribosomal protein S15P/S13E
MDEQQTQRINEAAKEFSGALADSYRAFTNRTVSTQEQVAQLMQAFFEGVIEHLRAQAQGNQKMAQELVDQQQQQRKAVQALAQETVEDYMRLLDYMRSYYRLLVASRSKRV